MKNFITNIRAAFPRTAGIPISAGNESVPIEEIY
jgi:hypothetical protein